LLYAGLEEQKKGFGVLRDFIDGVTLLCAFIAK
jgi:hypothetical protein